MDTPSRPRAEHEQANAGPAIARIQDALTTISRRGSARIRRSNQALSPVDHSLLSYIRTHSGCRAVDIATHFELNRSTVSRQLGALAQLGLVRMPEPGTRQSLQLTPSGEAALEDSAQLINQVLTERLQAWSTADMEAFATMLDRFNQDMESD